MHGILNDQSLIYLQIARMLEDDILRGIYQEEEQVPSTNELARGYNINPATAAKGINMLVADGILYKKRGIGMFVSPGAGDTVKPLVKEGTAISLTGEELLSMVDRAIKEGEQSC